jgi:predicted Fe-Mo cluster-binding NifX family protein
MKIGISATGKDLDSLLDPRFGRCAYFLMVDTDTEEFEAISNPGISAGGGAGIQAAQEITKQGAKEVITGHCGPNAFDVLVAGGVKIYQACPSLQNLFFYDVICYSCRQERTGY